MKKYKNIFLIFAIFLLTTSCSEDFLKPDPLSFFSPENVYVDKAGFESLILSMRKDMKAENYNYMNNISMDYTTSDLGSPWSQLDFYKLTPNSSQYYPFLDMYINTYSAIKNANVLISRIDDIEWDSDQEKMLYLF